MLGLEGLVSKRNDRPYRAGISPNWVKVKNTRASGYGADQGNFPMRPILRGKYLDERLRFSRREAADHECGGWIDVSDLGAVVDDSRPLPHPAIDQPQ
jgi:hypothetical protein